MSLWAILIQTTTPWFLILNCFMVLMFESAQDLFLAILPLPWSWWWVIKCRQRGFTHCKISTSRSPIIDWVLHSSGVYMYVSLLPGQYRPCLGELKKECLVTDYCVWSGEKLRSKDPKVQRVTVKSVPIVLDWRAQMWLVHSALAMWLSSAEHLNRLKLWHSHGASIVAVGCLWESGRYSSSRIFTVIQFSWTSVSHEFQVCVSLWL